MSRLQKIPGLAFLESEPLRAATLREEPDWALVERITGKKCPETVNIRSLSRMTESELVRTLGLSDSQGKKLSAALVLGKRLADEAIERGVSVANAKDVFRIFSGQMKDAKKESFFAVTLDQKHKIIDLHRISEGTLSMTPVHPREAFNPVIRDHAAAVIFVHNHPSGNPEPSPEDHALTTRLAEAGNLLGIRVVDHVVIGNGSFASLRDRGFDFERGSGPAQAAESGYAGGVREFFGKSDMKETILSPRERNVKEVSVVKEKEEGHDSIAMDPPDTRLIFEFGSGHLKYMDVTLSSADWNRMVENAAMGYTGHLLEEREDGVSVLVRSYKGTGEERIAAMNEMSRLNGRIPESEKRTPYRVIDHSHFEQALPSMSKQAAENSRDGASSGKGAAGQETPARSSPQSRRERGGMGF